MIKCPECGKEVSEKAVICPNCAYPIADSKPDGIVQIKMTALQRGAFGGKQKATLSAGGKVLWEGQVGQIAEVYFNGPTSVDIQYKTSAMYYGGKCSGMIDPSKGKKYSVHSRQGVMKTVMELQRVDYIDAD